MLYTSFVHQQLIGHIFSKNVRTTIQAMMNALLQGTINPALINVSMLRKLFIKYPKLTNSIIMREPSLVYQFGRIFPVRIDLDSFKFAFILEVPIPSESDLIPYFKILNLGWNDPHNSAHLQLPLPQYVTRQDDGSFAALDMSACKTKPGISYCQSDAYQHNDLSKCLDWVIEANRADPDLIDGCK
jgi:hypothetical protein